MAEMVIFLSLIIPMPFTWRRKLFTFISGSPLIAKLQYGMKVRRHYRALRPWMLTTLADYLHLHPYPFP
jgi:Bap31/Bap29 transmembrane region